jgi:hypothetical protein
MGLVDFLLLPIKTVICNDFKFNSRSVCCLVSLNAYDNYTTFTEYSIRSFSYISITFAT